MSIKPENFRHVWERFLELDTDKDERIKQLNQEIAQHEDSLRGLIKVIKDVAESSEKRDDAGKELKEVKQQRLECLEALQRQYEAPLVTVDDAFVEDRRNEFARICALPQVCSASVDSNNAINLIVRATYKYRGTTYYMGDWAIIFGHPHPFSYPVVTNYGRNLRPPWEPGRYPDYSMDDNSFCLGDNGSIIARHFKHGRYFQAIQVAIYAVNSVNEGDVDDVPHAFYPLVLTPHKKGSVRWPLSITGLMTFTS
jgi:hypothetical protein